MNKLLPALVALTCAGAACAQSSVTVFGVVDIVVSGYQNKSENLFGATAKSGRTVLSSNGYNSSRLGFRGTEDLGGGMSASFWLEAALFPDDGTIGTNTANSGPSVMGFFSRRSTVSLSGAFGELRLGRDYTPTVWNDSVFDPFGSNGIGTSILFSAGTFSTGGAAANGFQANNMYVRASNTVGYFLPPNLGGFYGQVMYAFNEKTKYDPGLLTPNAPGVVRAGGYVGGRFGYNRGPLDMAVGYGQSTLADAYFAGLTTKLNAVNFGASYDFGVIKVMAEYAKSSIKTKNTGVPVALAEPDATGWLLGATVPVGPGLVRFSYSQLKIDPDRGPLYVGGAPKAAKWALGYVHNLSKRTALYATIAQVNNSNGYDLGLGGSPAFVSGGSYKAKTSRGYDFGLRHAF